MNYKNATVRKKEFQKELTLIKQVKHELSHYWYFKDVGFRSELRVCNKCHDELVTAYELEKHRNIECKRC